MKIVLNEQGGIYQPFGTITGQIQPLPNISTDLILFWYTKGRGTEDVTIADRQSISPTDSNLFEFTLPDEPYSFSGKLVSVIWALELVDKKNKVIDRVEFTVSPTGEEIILNSIEIPENEGNDLSSRFKRWGNKLNAQGEK